MYITYGRCRYLKLLFSLSLSLPTPPTRVPPPPPPSQPLPPKRVPPLEYPHSHSHPTLFPPISPPTRPQNPQLTNNTHDPPNPIPLLLPLSFSSSSPLRLHPPLLPPVIRSPDPKRIFLEHLLPFRHRGWGYHIPDRHQDFKDMAYQPYHCAREGEEECYILG